MVSAEHSSLEDLKRRAVELRLQGLRPKEISALLDSGYSAWVVGKWLRKVGVPPTRERVLELASKREPHEIAKSIGISKRRVLAILQDAGFSERTRRSTEQNVDLFLSNPAEHRMARFTQSAPFGWALLKRCTREVDKAPITGLPVVETAIELLDRIRSTRRVESKKRQALCLYLQARGIEAHVYTVTSRHSVALEKLQEALKSSAGCIRCEADLLRRLGLLYGWLKLWCDAYGSLRGAIERYQSLGTGGHDLYGNGIANCLLLKSVFHYLTLSPEAGAEEARRGLRTLTGRESPTLFRNLVFALAKCLQPSLDPKDVQESQELLDWCLGSLESKGEPSVARVMIYWLRGLLAKVSGWIDQAVEDLTLAFDDATVLQLEQDATSILADLGALNPEPREIRSYIEDFCDWSDTGDLIVPSWLSNLDTEIRAVYEIALKSRNRIEASTFVALREAAGGESRMPAFIIPSQPGSTIFRQGAA